MNRRQTVLGWGIVTGGFVALGAGWAGVQSTPVVAIQVSYLASGGLTGLALVVLGTGLLRHDDLRAIRHGVEELRDRIDDLEHDIADTKDWLQTVDAKRIRSLAAENGAPSVVLR